MRSIDIVAQAYDAGIRLGEAVQRDMVTVRLTEPFEVLMVAAPEYLRFPRRTSMLPKLRASIDAARAVLKV